MKILHINTQRTWRGGEKQALGLIKGLLDRNYDVLLLCRKNSALHKQSVENHISVDTFSPICEFDPIAVSKLIRVCKIYKPDIVHVHDSHSHALAWLANCTPLVVSRRVSFPLRSGWLSLKKYRFAKNIIAVSNDIKNVLIAEGIKENIIEVIHSAVQSDEFLSVNNDLACTRKSLGINSNSCVVGAVAHLAEHKGIDVFITSIKHILNSRNNLRFLIAGEGKIRNELENFAREEGVREHIIFTGYIPNISQLLSIMSVFVLPSIAGEGSPAVIKEALLSQIPVVATDCGGVREILQNGKFGKLVPVSNHIELANAILDVLANREYYHKLAIDGKEFIESTFSFEQLVQKTIEVYKSL